MKFAIVVCWHNQTQIQQFLDAWNVITVPEWLFLERDSERRGCAKTKNTGILRALEANPEFVLVLDDDVYPHDTRHSRFEDEYFPWGSGNTTSWNRLEYFAKLHLNACEPQQVQMYEAITDPPSRGTPYFNKSIEMPVAASMSFWLDNPDWDAPSQLVHGDKQMTFVRKAIWGRFFAFSGMACCFRAEFWPHFKFMEDVGRMDDIWGPGYTLQAEAYRRGYCINTAGPLVRHTRQSNVWQNLRVEAEFIEQNETEWVQHAKKLIE